MVTECPMPHAACMRIVRKPGRDSLHMLSPQPLSSRMWSPPPLQWRPGPQEDSCIQERQREDGVASPWTHRLPVRLLEGTLKSREGPCTPIQTLSQPSSQSCLSDSFGLLQASPTAQAACQANSGATRPQHMAMGHSGSPCLHLGITVCSALWTDLQGGWPCPQCCLVHSPWLCIRYRHCILDMISLFSRSCVLDGQPPHGGRTRGDWGYNASPGRALVHLSGGHCHGAVMARAR